MTSVLTVMDEADLLLGTEGLENLKQMAPEWQGGSERFNSVPIQRKIGKYRAGFISELNVRVHWFTALVTVYVSVWLLCMYKPIP